MTGIGKGDIVSNHVCGGRSVRIVADVRDGCAHLGAIGCSKVDRVPLEKVERYWTKVGVAVRAGEPTAKGDIQ